MAISVTKAGGFRRLLLLTAAIMGLLFGSVGATRALGSVSPAAAHGTRGTTRIAWRGCGVRLQCSRVRVPLDWSRPWGPTISLPVVRYLASRHAGRIGALFVNGGGASGSV